MEVETLKRLALMGANREQVSLSSSIFASSLGTSTQTAARKLSLLEDKSFVAGVVTSEGQRVRITDKGMLRLQSEYLDYKHVFENAPGYRHQRQGRDRPWRRTVLHFSRRLPETAQPEVPGLRPVPRDAELEVIRTVRAAGANAIKIDRSPTRTVVRRLQVFKVSVGGIRCAILRADRQAIPRRCWRSSRP